MPADDQTNNPGQSTPAVPDPFADGVDWVSADHDGDGLKNMEDKTPLHASEDLARHGFDPDGKPLPGYPDAGSVTQLPDNLPNEHPDHLSS